MIKFSKPKRSIAADESGVTLVEFAFVAPILVTLVMGLLDIAHTQYTASVVTGAMQKAGRDMSLEDAGSSLTTLDARVESIVQTVAPQAVITTSRLSHFDFSDIGQAEAFTDDNSDGICNNNEVFEDMNGNNTWDEDRGVDGLGGARDAVVFTANVSYPRLFPMAAMIGLPERVVVEATTVLRNQPYDNQTRTITTGNCT
jgi:Flp pilus assembly protein TadG